MPGPAHRFEPRPLYALLDKSVETYGDKPFLDFLGKTMTSP